MSESGSGGERPVRRRTGGRITSGEVLRIAVLLVGLYAVIQVFWVAHSVFLLAFLGVLFGLTLSVPVGWLQRHKVPRGLGVAMVMLAVIGTMFGAGALVAPQVADQMSELKTQLPEAVDRARHWIEKRQGGVRDMLGDSSAAAGPGSASNEQQTGAAGGGLSGFSTKFFSFFSSTLAVVGGILLIFFVTVYVAVEPELYHEGLLHLIPRKGRREARAVLKETGVQLRRWLVTQGIAMVSVGVVTTVTLLLLGVKAAIGLGMIAGLFEFIPVVGPILSSIPAIGMAFLDGPEKALSVLIAYIIIQQAENHLLIPLLMKGRMNLPPVLTLLAQAVMSLVFGFVGLLVAVPLLATIMVPIRMLYVRDVVGEKVTLQGDG